MDVQTMFWIQAFYGEVLEGRRRAEERQSDNWVSAM
jgi:hypothetical protein